MKKFILLSLLCVSLLSPLAHGATMEDLQFDDQIKLANSELRLNGLGLRSIFIFKAYVAGLYLSKKVSTGPAAVAQSGPKRIRMQMLMGIDADDIKKALIDGMRKNVSEPQWVAMQDRVAQFRKIVDAIGAVRSGDSINLDYVPSQGFQVAVNDVPRGAPIPGQDFYNALLEIFVGADPVDTRLRNGLLGQ